MERVEMSAVRIDWTLYPRAEISPANLQSLRDALDMGAELPPLIAWKDNGALVDGVHRFTVHRERAAEWVAVEWREYDSKADAFADAVRLNATHGLRLSRGDHARIMERARELGLAEKQIPVLLKVPVDRVSKGGPASFKSWPGPQPLPGGLDALAQDYDAAVIEALKDVIKRLAPDKPKPGGDPIPYVRRIAQVRGRGGAELRGALLNLAAACAYWAAHMEQDEVAA